MKRMMCAVAAVSVMGCMQMNESQAQTPPLGPPEATLAAMRADAAMRASVTVADVHIESTQSVTWRDASLGCPQPGMMYAQILVPGWRVVIAAGGKRLDYHVGRRGNWLRCPADRVQEPLPGNPAV
ncbi:hypothetical protein [uncultured Piscinibacter sp.]|uniref:hypothetical protein n=1 Tax=uncultured Piscinibacter sp. TaxID=1131835 RepID=UPI00260EEADC|nr:hypothetical protein [uncultured Piscinibacter sp.]